MAKNERAVGHTRAVSGFATGALGGDLVIVDGWPGVVQKDIIGTSEPLKTIEGRIVEGEFGDGKGDIQVEGVFKFIDEEVTPLSQGDLVMLASPSGVKASTGSSRVGHVWEGPVIEGGVRFVEVKLLGAPHQD